MSTLVECDTTVELQVREYKRLNGDSDATEQDIEDKARYQGEYFDSVWIPVPQFQEDGI